MFIDFSFSVNKLFHLFLPKLIFFVVVTKISFKDHDYEYHYDPLRVSLMSASQFCFRRLQCYNI